MPTNGNTFGEGVQSRRNILRTIGGVSGASLLAGCSGGNSSGNSSSNSGGNSGGNNVETVELFTSNLSFLEEQIKEMLSDFEGEFGEQYGIEETEWTDRGPEVEAIVSYLSSRFRDNDAPEVIEMYTSIFSNYATKEGVFVDHQKFDRYDEVTERFYDGLMEDLTFDGEVRSLPHYLSFPVIYSNNELFEEAGLEPPSVGNRFSLDKALDTAVELVENSSAEFGFMFRKSGAEMYNMLYSEGIDLMNEDRTEAAFNTDRTVEIMTRLQKLTEDGVIPNLAWTGFFDEPAQQFGAGTVGMNVQTVAAIRLIGNYGEGWVTGDTMTVGPALENERFGAHMGRNPIGVVGAGKPEATQQAAFDLASVATNKEYMEGFLRSTTVLVPHEEAVKSVRSDEKFTKQNPNLTEAYELFDNLVGETRSQIYMDGISEIYDTMLSGMSDIGLGNVDPQEGLDSMEKNVNQILQRD